MADKTIQVIQVGAGATGKATVRYLIERGCEVVACVDAYCHEGEDIGALAGIGRLGITVEKDLAAALERTRPDIATVCTVSELRRVYPLLKTIVEHGVNVVTLAEEAFFPGQWIPGLLMIWILWQKNIRLLYWEPECRICSGSL